MGVLLEHPRLKAKKIYEEHKRTCPECSLPPAGSTLRVYDLCEKGKALWAKSTGREKEIENLGVDPLLLLD